MNAILGILKIVAALFALAGPIAAGAGVYYYDHRAVGQPTWAHFDFLFIHIHPPESLKAQLGDANYKLSIALKSEATLEQAVDQQNAAIQTLHTSADRWQAQSQAAVSKAVQGNAWRGALARKIDLETVAPDTSKAGLCDAAEAVLREGGQ